jgi:alcohol dehydrogenase, propanol-preferring
LDVSAELIDLSAIEVVCLARHCKPPVSRQYKGRFLFPTSNVTTDPKISKGRYSHLILTKGSAKIHVQDHPVKSPDDLAPGECLVKMHCSGLCHTDLHASLDDWPLKPMSPLIGGREGVGEFVVIGKNTTNSPVQIGQRVGIKWIAYSCFNCEQCRNGHEQSGYFGLITTC